MPTAACLSRPDELEDALSMSVRIPRSNARARDPLSASERVPASRTDAVGTDMVQRRRNERLRRAREREKSAGVAK